MTIAETTSGPVEGRIKDDVLLFAGIPYAAPPTGRNRFRAALPPDPWREVRPAVRFGPAAPQLPGGGLTDSAPVRWDEDCLTLNVCTPALDGARRPVLFWVHGGAYRTGQGAIPWYNGARFASQGDLVVVSINYRLGALGFTDLSHFGTDYATSGANGLLDQITALRWVQENIERFGGDPARVTIAGESAGAFSVATLLASPLAKGLFRGAIAQSGGLHHTLPPAAGRLVAERLLETLKVNGIEALQQVPAAEILQAQARICAALGDGVDALAQLGVPVSPFYPVEGNVVVPERPLAAVAAGASRGIPLLAGTNRHETTLFGFGEADEARLERIARGYGAESVLAVYRRHRPTAAPDELLVALTTDHLFRIPVIRLLEARSALPDTPGWMYWFTWESRAFGGRLKSTHALEIPFVFDNLDRPGVEVFLGPGPQPRAVASAMHRAWIDFVRDGDPGWPAYDLERRPTMRFDEVPELVLNPDGAERAAWQGLR